MPRRDRAIMNGQSCAAALPAAGSVRLVRAFEVPPSLPPLRRGRYQAHRFFPTMTGHRVGLWLVGAFGGVGTAITVGLAAMKRGLADRTGLVTELPDFRGLAASGAR